MSDSVRIRLEPLGQTVDVKRGTPLQDLLFAYGVEFPCGGRSRCKRCRIKVLDGSLPVSPDEELAFTQEELAEGWRLACRAKAETALTLEIEQWESAILADNSPFEFTPGEGLGVAVDLGTTTLVAQLLDLRSGHVVAVRTSLNPQVAYGSDIMSRVEYSLQHGQQKLEDLIRTEIRRLIEELAGHREIREVVIVGNTVMHHLFCGLDVEPLSHCPFEPAEGAFRVASPSLPGYPPVRFLPCLGSFVGSDILAGVLATRMHQSESLIGLVDLGTNGEIIIGNRERMVCASTAAGPAFEGGRISMGMRASTGAISEVGLDGNRLKCHVIGQATPRGICGSGLVDAVSAGLELGWIESSGRLAADRNPLPLCPPVTLTQRDIRELQMAKAAIAAGIQIVLRKWGATVEDIQTLYLAGAFGNYINRSSARSIGLIDFPPEKVQPAGNTALLGAKLALFNHEDLAAIRSRVVHISLADDPQFQDIYVDSMMFAA